MSFPLTARIRRWVFGCACVVAAAIPLHADADTKTPPSAPTRELAIVVCDTISMQPTRGLNSQVPATQEYGYDRVARIFPDVFEYRKWPLTYTTVRLAAGEPEHPLELRIFLRGVHPDIYDLTFRAWVTLTVDGKAYDFGIVRSESSRHAFENYDTVLERIYRDAAEQIANKIGAILFPKPPKH